VNRRAPVTFTSTERSDMNTLAHAFSSTLAPLRRAAALLALSASLSLPAAAATYEIDAGHTNVGFKVKHMMVSWVRGSFGTVSGTIEFDAAKPAATKVNAKVNVGSIDTGLKDRDDHLRGADFFDVAKYAEITFTGKEVKAVTADGFDVVGDLNMHGVSKPATFHFTTPAAERKDPWGNIKSGFTATAKINRQDWGLTWNKALDEGGVVVGDEIIIEIDVELSRK
jgi:polyisoprenoid-binding protein YceI